MLPRVLVLDEPTSDLDPVGTAEILAVLRTLNKQYGMTILLIEHKIDPVVPWVDRVILMDEGKVVVDAPPRKAFDNLQRWYDLGVSVPQVVQLARALPDIFGETTPLSVEEAYDALRDTRYARSLLQRNQMLSASERATPLLSSPSSTEQSILSWEAVGLSYGVKQVLKDITVNVQPEEWVAIIGPNGSGKTSLASLAIGLLASTTGVVRYKGRRIQIGHLSRQSESMAYLFQTADTMLFGATVEQKFLFGTKHRRRPQQESRIPVEELLEMVDLTAYRKSNPFHLSFGQRKRLAIGTLLSRQPDLLILDESTTGQDEGHARTFLQFLEELRRRKRLTYVMITHDMQAVARYASRIIVLKDGKVALDGPPDSVFAHVDELAESHIMSPPIAQLHARLCDGQAARVSLEVGDFLRFLQPIEVNS
jgi:energy-coupling factor transport system ATP-binding protein